MPPTSSLQWAAVATASLGKLYTWKRCHPLLKKQAGSESCYFFRNGCLLQQQGKKVLLTTPAASGQTPWVNHWGGGMQEDLPPPGETRSTTQDHVVPCGSMERQHWPQAPWEGIKGGLKNCSSSTPSARSKLGKATTFAFCRQISAANNAKLVEPPSLV